MSEYDSGTWKLLFSRCSGVIVISPVSKILSLARAVA